MNKIQELTDDDIMKKLKIYIRDKFLLGDDSETLNNDDSFLDKGIIDSTGVLELVNFVEETFSIKVDDEDLIPENLDSINNLILFIKKKN